MIINGTEITTEAELQVAIQEFDTNTQNYLRAEFNGLPWVQPIDEIQAETDKYFLRQRDGMLIYFQITAELRLAQQAGEITRAQNRAIEDALKPVRDEVALGQWRTGLEKLEEIGLAGGVISQQMYDRFNLVLTNYLASDIYQ